MSQEDVSKLRQLRPAQLLRRLRASAVTTGLTVIAAAGFWAAPILHGNHAQAKTPGKTYCFNRVCHRVLTLGETRRMVGKKTSVIASYYSHCRVDRFNPCGLTSSGAKFRPSKADNAASPIYPNGTKILVWNPANKRAAVIRIDNAGPYWRNRKLDLSAAAASKLGFRSRGVARLIVQVLKAPSRREARYRRHRTYPPVAGYIGRFPTMASALQRTGVPSTIEGRRIAAADIVLPVQNSPLAERRRWIAQLSVPRPVTVATAAEPSIRLPQRLLRSQLARASIKQPPRSNQKLASLTLKKERPSAARTKKPSRLSEKQTQSKAAKKRLSSAKVAGTKQGKKTRPRSASDIPTKTIKKPTEAQPQPVIATVPVAPKRDMSWRQRLLGINRSGA